MYRTILTAVVVVLAFASYAGAASAAGFNVNVMFDAVDAAPGDGVCADAGGSCTLRAAVQESNALPGWDDISVPGGVYPLSLLGPGEDLAATGDLDIRSELGIHGHGPRKTVIDGQQSDRIFDLRGASVAASGLGIRNGRATLGGGIRAVSSKLHLRWSALYYNSAPSSGVWPFVTLGAGGGLYASDSGLEVSGVSFFYNRASEMGGAAYVGAPSGAGHAELENVTMDANSARRGGGIFTHTVPTELRNLTIASNFAALGGGIYWLNIPPRLFNSSVAYNSGQDCSNPIVSTANNNDTDKTCGLFNPNDLPGVDPLLDPLVYLAGVLPNWVRPQQAGSPLRDSGDPGTCTATDEIGQARVHCDIGAYEQP